MIQNFTNYLGSLLGVENSSSITPRIADRDEEWVMVDREEEQDAPKPSSLTRASSASSLHSGSVMEESWFITPPPCFTSEGPNLSTSPLENLLIEHPSMSVYHTNTSSRRYFTGTMSDRSDEDKEEEEEEEEDSGNYIITQPAPTRTIWENYEEFVKIQDDHHLIHPSQKAEIQYVRTCLSRRKIERNNKAREVNCRNQRQRRGQRSQGAARSRASNNRKC